jgi:predicted PurR-regulated permease PerM
MSQIKEEYGKLILIVSFLAMIYIAYKVISPFIATLLSSIIIAIVVYPVYEKLKKKTKKKNLSSLIIVLSIIIFLLIPLLLFTNAMFGEMIGFHNTANSLNLTSQSDALREVTKINIDFERYFKEGLQEFSNVFIFSSSKIRSFLVGGVLNLFILFFTLFFFIRDGKAISKSIGKLIPFKERIKSKLKKELTGSIRGLMLGLLIIAVIEGILSFIGFTIFGIPTPLVWSFLIAIFAIIPLLGPAIVYIPAGIYLIINHQIIAAIVLVVYFMVTVSYTDMIIKPKVMSKTSKINQVAVLIGLLGGISLWGLPGIIIGPLVLAILLSIYRIYEEEYASKS